MTNVPQGFWDESIFDELEEGEFGIRPARPDGFGVTVVEYAKKGKCSTDGARKVLETAVKKKILIKVMMRVNTKNTGVFCRPEEWTPKK